MKSVYVASVENRKSAIEEMSDIAFIDIDDDDNDDAESFHYKASNKTEDLPVKQSLHASNTEIETERVGVFDYFSKSNTTLNKADQCVDSNVEQCGSDNYYLGPRSVLPISNAGAKNFKEASQRAHEKFSNVKDPYDNLRLHQDGGWVRLGSQPVSESAWLRTNSNTSSLGVDRASDSVSTFSSLVDNQVSQSSFKYLYQGGEDGRLPLEQRATRSVKANSAPYDEAHVVFDSSDSDSSAERRRPSQGQYEQSCDKYARNSAERSQFQRSAESRQRYDYQHKTQFESGLPNSHFDTRVNFPLSSRLNGSSSKESVGSHGQGFSERDIGTRNGMADEKSSSCSTYAKPGDWRNHTREKDGNGSIVGDQHRDISSGDGRRSLDVVLGSNLSVVGNSGLVVPQYRLLREDPSLIDDDVDYESKSIMQKLEKMQRRRQARKQKQTAGLSTADSVPGFRGKESIDELINYIDASESTSNVKASTTKQNKKKKTVKSISSKSNNKVIDAACDICDCVSLKLVEVSSITESSEACEDSKQLHVFPKEDGEMKSCAVIPKQVENVLAAPDSSSLTLSNTSDVVSDDSVCTLSGAQILSDTCGMVLPVLNDNANKTVVIGDSVHLHDDSFVTVQRKKRSKGSNVLDGNVDQQNIDRQMETTERRGQSGIKVHCTPVTSVCDVGNNLSEPTCRPLKLYSVSSQRSMSDRRSASTVSGNTLLSQSRNPKSNHAIEGAVKSNNGGNIQDSRAFAKGPSHRTKLVEKATWNSNKQCNNVDSKHCIELTISKDSGNKVRSDVYACHNVIVCGDEIRSYDTMRSRDGKEVSVVQNESCSKTVTLHSSSVINTPCIVADKIYAVDSAFSTCTASSTTSCGDVCVTATINSEQSSEQAQLVCDYLRQVLSDTIRPDAVATRIIDSKVTYTNNGLLNSSSTEIYMQTHTCCKSSVLDQSNAICTDLKPNTAIASDSRSVSRRPNQSVVFLDTQNLQDSTPIRSDLSFGYDPEIPTLPQIEPGGVTELPHSFTGHHPPVLAPVLHYITGCPAVVYFPPFSMLPPVPRCTPVGVVPPMQSEVCQVDTSARPFQSFVKTPSLASSHQPTSSVFDLFSAQDFMHSEFQQTLESNPLVCYCDEMTQ